MKKYVYFDFDLTNGIEYLTRDKRYEIKSKNRINFKITDNDGHLLLCCYEKGAHLDFNNWEIEEK